MKQDFGEINIFKNILDSLKTKPFVHVWGRMVPVFVNKINNLATQSWGKNSGLCSIEYFFLIWPELSKQCYNLSCILCRMNFLSNILTWLNLPGTESNYFWKLFAYILLWDNKCDTVCFLSHSYLLGQIIFIFRFSSSPSPLFFASIS